MEPVVAYNNSNVPPSLSHELNVRSSQITVHSTLIEPHLLSAPTVLLLADLEFYSPSRKFTGRQEAKSDTRTGEALNQPNGARENHDDGDIMMERD